MTTTGTYDVSTASPQELLATFAAILSELRRRNLIRSTNNPVADYAEVLVARALGLKLTAASTTGHDAVDDAGNRYEIKARRLTSANRSRQLSAIRGLDKEHFTHLVSVLFLEDFRVFRAALIPRDVVCQRATYKTHVNAWILHVPDAVWNCTGVRDITDDLQRIQTFESPARSTVASTTEVVTAAEEPTTMKRTQRDVMRELVKRHGLNRDAVVAAYVSAELAGEAPRERNSRGIDAETYARALWADGVKKGWF